MMLRVRARAGQAAREHGSPIPPRWVELVGIGNHIDTVPRLVAVSALKKTEAFMTLIVRASSRVHRGRGSVTRAHGRA